MNLIASGGGRARLVACVLLGLLLCATLAQPAAPSLLEHSQRDADMTILYTAPDGTEAGGLPEEAAREALAVLDVGRLRNVALVPFTTARDLDAKVAGARSEHLVIFAHGEVEGLLVGGQLVTWDALKRAVSASGATTISIGACHSARMGEVEGKTLRTAFEGMVDYRYAAAQVALDFVKHDRPQLFPEFKTAFAPELEKRGGVDAYARLLLFPEQPLQGYWPDTPRDCVEAARGFAEGRNPAFWNTEFLEERYGKTCVNFISKKATNCNFLRTQLPAQYDPTDPEKYAGNSRVDAYRHAGCDALSGAWASEQRDRPWLRAVHHEFNVNLMEQILRLKVERNADGTGAHISFGILDNTCVTIDFYALAAASAAAGWVGAGAYLTKQIAEAFSNEILIRVLPVYPTTTIMLAGFQLCPGVNVGVATFDSAGRASFDQTFSLGLSIGRIIELNLYVLGEYFWSTGFRLTFNKSLLFRVEGTIMKCDVVPPAGAWERNRGSGPNPVPGPDDEGKLGFQLDRTLTVGPTQFVHSGGVHWLWNFGGVDELSGAQDYPFTPYISRCPYQEQMRPTASAQSQSMGAHGSDAPDVSPLGSTLQRLVDLGVAHDSGSEGAMRASFQTVNPGTSTFNDLKEKGILRQLGVPDNLGPGWKVVFDLSDPVARQALGLSARPEAEISSRVTLARPVIVLPSFFFTGGAQENYCVSLSQGATGDVWTRPLEQGTPIEPDTYGQTHALAHFAQASGCPPRIYPTDPLYTSPGSASAALNPVAAVDAGKDALETTGRFTVRTKQETEAEGQRKAQELREQVRRWLTQASDTIDKTANDAFRGAPEEYGRTVERIDAVEGDAEDVFHSQAAVLEKIGYAACEMAGRASVCKDYRMAFRKTTHASDIAVLGAIHNAKKLLKTSGGVVYLISGCEVDTFLQEESGPVERDVKSALETTRPVRASATASCPSLEDNAFEYAGVRVLRDYYDGLTQIANTPIVFTIEEASNVYLLRESAVFAEAATLPSELLEDYNAVINREVGDPVSPALRDAQRLARYAESASCTVVPTVCGVS